MYALVFIAMNEKPDGSLLPLHTRHVHPVPVRVSVDSSQCASLRFRRAIREKCPKLADTIGLTLHSASRNTCTKHRNEKMISSYGALSCSNCLRPRGGTRIRECSAFYFLFSTAIRTNLDWHFHWFFCVLQDLRVCETGMLLNFSKPWKRGNIFKFKSK